MKLKATIVFPLLLILSCAAFAQDKVTLRTADKWNLSALYNPSQNGKYVILLHDLGSKKEEYPSFSRALDKAGFGYLALDLRGHGQSTNINTYDKFEKTGVNNEFNKMTRDVDAAIDYLRGKGASEGDIFILGAGLGANVAAKSLPFHPKIGGVVLLTPSLKNRDVLTMVGIKNFKGPVFIGVSSIDRKQLMEASFIRNAAYLASGKGKVTFMTAYNLKGVDMLDRYLTQEVLQWLITPQLPEVLPDAISFEEETYNDTPSAAPKKDDSPAMTMGDVLKSLD